MSNKVVESEQPGYKIPFLMSVVLHLSLISLLFINLPFMAKPVTAALQTEQPVKIVDAVKLDQDKIEAEIKRINQAEQMKKKQEEDRVRNLQKKAMEAQRKQEQEKKKLAKLEEAKKQLQKKQLTEQKEAEKKLAELKAKQLAEAERVKKTEQEALKADKKKLEKEKELAELEKKKEQEVVTEKENQQEEDEKQLQEQLAQEQAQMQAKQSKRLQTEIEKYTALITQAVGQHWIVPDSAGKETSCVLLIRVAPGGAVIDVKLLRSSGDPVLDRSAQSAVFKASPLPVPENPTLFETFREIRLLVRPEGYLT